MALGTPVVATTKGAEGLDLTSGEDLLIADDPDAFADATSRLLIDDALHARIAAHAQETVATRYDWEMIGAAMLEAVTRLTSRWAAQRGAGGPAAVMSAPGTVETVTEPAIRKAAIVRHGHDT
jgi:spore maturation protein CgeB